MNIINNWNGWWHNIAFGRAKGLDFKEEDYLDTQFGSQKGFFKYNLWKPHEFDPGKPFWDAKIAWNWCKKAMWGIVWRCWQGTPGEQQTIYGTVEWRKAVLTPSREAGRYLGHSTSFVDPTRLAQPARRSHAGFKRLPPVRRPLVIPSGVIWQWLPRG